MANTNPKLAASTYSSSIDGQTSVERSLDNKGKIYGLVPDFHSQILNTRIFHLNNSTLPLVECPVRTCAPSDLKVMRDNNTGSTKTDTKLCSQ
eukprot:scaffold1593_cov76-Cylindrotheca_fusiformis.AAC.3